MRPVGFRVSADTTYEALTRELALTLQNGMVSKLHASVNVFILFVLYVRLEIKNKGNIHTHRYSVREM